MRPRDSRLVFASDGALAAAGLVSQPPPGGSHARTAGGVHPDWRGRGTGRALLSWQFERIAEIRAERGSTAEWIVSTGAGIADESAARLFRRFGLHRVRYFLQMRAPTAGVRPVPPPDGIRIAEYTADLRAIVHGTHADAFADHWGFDLYICQVGTRPPWRKRGLAMALLAASLAAGAADGKTTASLGVDADSPTGAVTVYERLGFTAQHSPFAVYHRSLDRADLSSATPTAGR
jgi:mycothiol synthase